MNREQREKWAQEWNEIKGESPQKKIDKLIEFIEKEYNLDIEV